MHIVSITLSGFRSFRNETIIDLSKGINVLVGPNGVGKSNVILGLEFLFTRKYSRLDSKQREEWICNLNPNENQNNLEASVSVIIDNSDRSIPEQGQIITFKRRISAKKDQYFLNDRLIKFDQVIHMWESAGFSPNHSNFIVPQRLITEIALATPEELLEILRNLSGASRFDDRKNKIFENNESTESNIGSINSIIEELEINFQTMNLNSNSIKVYLSNKKIQEYLRNKILIMKHESLKASIDSKNDQKRSIQNRLEQEMAILEELKSQISFNQETLNDWKSNIEKHEREKQTYFAIITETQNQIIKLETNLKEEEKIIFDNSQFKQINESLNINSVQLTSNKKILNELESKEKLLVNEMDKLKNARNNSYCILNMENKSIEEKRKLIENKLNSVKKVILDNSNSKNYYLEYIKRITNEKLNILKQLEENSEEIVEGRIKILTNEIKNLEKSNVNLHISRKKELVAIQTIETKIIDLESTIVRLENHLNNVSFRAIKDKKIIEKIINSFRTRFENCEGNQVEYDKMIVEGYYGQFIDLIEISDPGMEKAVDVLLKNKIFYYLVESSEVAEAILKEIEKMEEKPDGCINFMALNLIDPQDTIYEEGSEIPLYQVLEYNENLSLSIRSLCKRKIISKDLFNSSAKSNSFNDYASLNGDLYTRWGVYQIASSDKSRLSLYKEWKVKLEEFNSLNQELAVSKLHYEELEKQLENQMSQITINQMEIEKIRKFCEDIPNLKNKLNDINHREKDVTREIEFTNINLMKFNEELAMLESYNCEQEKIDFDGERIKCDELNQQLFGLELDFDKVKKDYNNVKKKVEEAEMTIINLEKQKLILAKFNNNSKNESIEENIKWLKDQIEELTTSLHNTQTQLEASCEQCENAHTNHEEVEQLIRPLQKRLNQNFINISELKTQTVLINNELYQLNDRLEKIKSENDIVLLNDRLLSVEIPNKYRRLETMDQLNSALIDIEEQISTSNISKSSMEFYEQHMEEFEKLKETKDIITRESIPKFYDLLYVVENEKKSFIYETYHLVKKNFQQIFQKLVNNQGNVQMKFLRGFKINSVDTNNNTSTSLDNQINNNLDISSQSLSNCSDIASINSLLSSIATSSQQLISAVDDCVGIQILANFDNSNKFTELQSLSGGQKTIISAAFIFALQQIDSTPFFVFDEIDANLDETWRKSLSMMIKQLSEKKQFILSTFRPELCGQADKLFGILNQEGLSSVSVISKQDALNFITQSK